MASKLVQFVLQFIFGGTGQDLLLHVVLYEFAALANLDRCLLLVSRQDPNLNVSLNKHIYALRHAKLKLILDSGRSTIRKIPLVRVIKFS